MSIETFDVIVEVPVIDVEVEDTPAVSVTVAEDIVAVITIEGPPGGQGPPGQGVQVFGESLTGADGTETVFTTASPYLAGSTAVYVNGLREFRGDAYTETGASTITFIDPPLNTDSIRVDYIIQS